MNISQLIVPIIIITVLAVLTEIIRNIHIGAQSQAEGDAHDDRVSGFQKKKYIFDTTAEFKLFKILVELFGDQYYVLTQVNYNHLVEPKKTTWKEGQALLNKVIRKSADFVLCDKQQVIPRLVISLDGSVHAKPKVHETDMFVDDLMKSVGLPILRLRNNQIDRDFVSNIVNAKLID